MVSQSDSTILEPPFHLAVRGSSGQGSDGTASPRPLALRGHERVLVFGCCPVGSESAFAEKLDAGGRVVAVEACFGADVSRGREGRNLPLEYRRGALHAALAPSEWGTFDVVLARGLPTPGRDPLRLVRSLVRAARPGARIALFEDRRPTLSAWPALRGLAETMRAYDQGLLLSDNPTSAPRDLATLLAAGGADVRRAGHVASGGTAGDPRFDRMVDHVLALLRGAHGLRSPGEVAATIEALGEWRTRSDAALLAMTRFAEGRRPPLRGFFALTP